MENIFVEFLPPWVETGIQPAFYDKESGTVLQQTARMYARVNMLIRMFNKLSKQTKEEVERFEGVVNDEIERFEGVVNNTVEEYIEKFNDLHDYVEDYFDNLDVQEEINHKIDELIADGDLQQIIYDYLQPKVTWSYGTVAEMQADTNLIDGNLVTTYGFYTAGDGGGAEYLIKTADVSDVIDNSTIIAISDTLNAHLVIKDKMYVKQFGCKGDDSTDDTTLFNIAIANSKKLFINSGVYLISRFLPEENQTIEGAGYNSSIIKVNGTVAPLCYIKSNTRIADIAIDCTKESLEWNRCDIYGKDNVIIERCKISGFRHDSLTPNAWGILVTDSTNVRISDCYFDNNSQSDIAIVQDTDTLVIEKCAGTALKINFEPNNDHPISNVTVKNCNMNYLHLLENTFDGTATRNITIQDCIIDLLVYDGASATFIDCKIKNFENEVVNGYSCGGEVKFINSINTSANLISDPYLDTYSQGGSEWKLGYTPGSWSSLITTTNVAGEGPCVVFNAIHSSTTISAQHSDISVNEGEVYLVRLNSKYEISDTSSVGYGSINLDVKYLDDTDTEVQRVKYSVGRHAIDTNSYNISTSTCLLKVPTGATKIRLAVWNSSYGSQSFAIRSIELFKVRSNIENSTNNMPELPIRKSRTFYGTAKPTGNTIPYAVGDKMIYTTPSTYEGAVCTVAGMGGTWKNFGALAS